MFFAVQGMMPADTIPVTRHVSIQRAVKQGRVDLDADVPEEVEQRYGRMRPIPEQVANLDALTRRRAVLDHLLDQIDAASHYMRVPAEDLPPYVWEWFSQGQAVVFVYTDPETGRQVQHVVVAVWADQSRASTRRNAEGGRAAAPAARDADCSTWTGDRVEQPHSSY
ncbi:hypothetical protein AB0B10_26220 [Micromonospora arborensis]|uniref:hypothetical protein n=1 Tax=Micromonospora arborensis TaxID=2116518 RepID=UPI0033F54B50